MTETSTDPATDEASSVDWLAEETARDDERKKKIEVLMNTVYFLSRSLDRVSREVCWDD